MKNIYHDDSYLETNPTWHEEDSPWKAAQIVRMFKKHKLAPRSIVEIGCGAGGILSEVRQLMRSEGGGRERPTFFSGFDIAPAAIAMARKKECENLKFYEQDLLKCDNTFDLLLVMDVIEHVPDYMGFLEACRSKAKYKIYHIPLDLHVSSVMRGTFVNGRASIGHIHYFSAESAMASLVDTGHHITDCFYTCGATGLNKFHRSLKRSIANIPRRLGSLLSVSFTARLLGGYSLLVLTTDEDVPAPPPLQPSANSSPMAAPVEVPVASHVAAN